MIGTPPNCRCPDGTQWSGRACQQLAVNPPPVQCPPGLVNVQGMCVQVTNPFGIFGTGESQKRQQQPSSGGGNDMAKKPAAPAAPTQPPAGGQVPTVFNSGTIKPGPSGAAQALRCQAPRQMINGVCACPGGASGDNCEKPYLR
jgi:hypothetical protein